MTVIIALVILASAIYHFRDVTLQSDERSALVAESTEAQAWSTGCSCHVHQNAPGTSCIAA